MNTRPLTPTEKAAYVRRYSYPTRAHHLLDVARIVGIDITGKTRRQIASALADRARRIAS